LRLEEGNLSIKDIAQGSKLSYAATLHHLHLLEVESVVARKGKKPYRWTLTGVGQQRLP
jgi:hypothetical protein